MFSKLHTFWLIFQLSHSALVLLVVNIDLHCALSPVHCAPWSNLVMLESCALRALLVTRLTKQRMRWYIKVHIQLYISYTKFHIQLCDWESSWSTPKVGNRGGGFWPGFWSRVRRTLFRLWFEQNIMETTYISWVRTWKALDPWCALNLDVTWC